MKPLFLTALFTVVCLSIQARAYIPSSQFIFDRVSSLHGKGAYKITMDLAISLENEVQNIKETWLVVDGGEMYLHAQGDGFRTARLLKRGRIFWIDQDGSERSSESGPEFFMSYLLIRSPLDLKRALVKNGYLTPDVLKEKRLPKEVKDIKLESEPFVRLGRNNGAVQYVYGQPDGPGLWIQQDHFYITKMRSVNGSTYSGSEFAAFSKNLVFPKNIKYQFTEPATGQVITGTFKVTGLSSIELTTDQKRFFDPTWVRTKGQDSITMWPTGRLSSAVQSFYKRFR